MAVSSFTPLEVVVFFSKPSKHASLICIRISWLRVFFLVLDIMLTLPLKNLNCKGVFSIETFKMLMSSVMLEHLAHGNVINVSSFTVCFSVLLGCSVVFILM